MSEVQLRKLIKEDLERDKSHEMDKKTLKRILENLKRKELIKTKDFRVSLYRSRRGNSEDSYSE